MCFSDFQVFSDFSDSSDSSDSSIDTIRSSSEPDSLNSKGCHSVSHPDMASTPLFYFSGIVSSFSKARPRGGNL